MAASSVEKEAVTLHRYTVDSVHFVTPTEDSRRPAAGMRSLA